MSQAYPLLNRFQPESTVAFYNGERISAARFLNEAWQLTARLPEKRYMLNLCEDRYHFLLGFAAALQARQVSLLPPNRAAGVLRELCGNYPEAYCLADHQDLPAGLDVILISTDLRRALQTPPIPVIPAGQTAVIVFTSGSTGSPTPHVKSWASLIKVAQSLGTRLGFEAGASVLGTIPPQHLYGMETTIMLPLQWGGSTHHGCPLLPADIQSAIQQISPPRWLMATPLHLRACISSKFRLTGLAGVLSATMPLSASLAAEVERLWQTTVHDVYGCTEAGTIALRRASANENWCALGRLRVSKKGEEVWVEGGHVSQPVRLPDQISIHNEHEFSLHGRMGDLVKIAGKRTSLDALNVELNRIPGVVDGIFFIPDEKGRQGSERLTAYVVAPGLNAQVIIAELRKRIDPAFLPRPLYFVKTLPRNATGKLPRENLRMLAAELSDPHRKS